MHRPDRDAPDALWIMERDEAAMPAVGDVIDLGWIRRKVVAVGERDGAAVVDLGGKRTSEPPRLEQRLRDSGFSAWLSW